MKSVHCNKRDHEAGPHDEAEAVRAAVGMGIPMGMGMGTVMNPHGFCGIFEWM